MQCCIWFAWTVPSTLVPYEWGAGPSKQRHKPRPPTFRRKPAFVSWKLADAAYVIMGQCIGQNGDHVELACKAVGNGTVRNPWRIMSLTIANLTNAQHLFFNTSNSITSSLYQYLDTTREQLRSIQGCLSANERSWIVSCRARWSSTPETVLALGFVPCASHREGTDASGMPLWLQGRCHEEQLQY